MTYQAAMDLSKLSFGARTSKPYGSALVMKVKKQPSPPWGRGWAATGAFTSRRGPGQGVLRREARARPIIP